MSVLGTYYVREYSVLFLTWRDPAGRRVGNGEGEGATVMSESVVFVLVHVLKRECF